MLCSVCYCMIRGHAGRQWRGSGDFQFGHHTTSVSLEQSAGLGCFICRIIWREWTSNHLIKHEHLHIDSR
ncbi:hypothetical protein B0J11DRAFT_11772 [Dendryphion nanum]|uniref:Uncharacterized protein n=1 Tax=Dendryphion nanum TaxID=256645 RepID=A0A9P9EIW7_9PLEO|nr:hypothetical protein B0J11DRAFT_11772 [Dendryphion nanum]